MRNIDKKTTVLLMLMLSSAYFQQARASDLELRDQILTVIGNRHPTETGDWWRSLDPSASEVIMALYEENRTGTNTYKKIRLIDALSWYDNSASVRFLKQEAENNPNRLLRNAAIRALGKSQGSREREFLSRSLGHSDPSTRLEAARALDDIQDIKSIEIVDKFMKAEKNPLVAQKMRNRRSLRDKTRVSHTRTPDAEIKRKSHLH